MTARTANCPNCGAEIVFRWSGAVQTTCPACRSILIRNDLDLTRVGTVADVPPAMSRVQLGTRGRYRDQPFEVVGRIIYAYEHGHWNEWHLRFADDSSGWLSDAQGEYAVTRQTTSTPVPVNPAGRRARATTAPPVALAPGSEVDLDGALFTVTSLTRATYAGVEGELPFEYWDKTRVEFIDLTGERGQFATLDFSEQPPLTFVGEYVPFAELALTDLAERDGSLASASAVGLNCPQCGAPIALRTGAAARTVVCDACGSILDAADPALAILEAHQRRTPIIPQLPLGTVGQWKGDAWQVVGFQVRGIVVDGTSYEWREYVLWHADRGVRYLTEYNGHWNDVATVKGVPTVVHAARPLVRHLGSTFKHFQSAIAVTHTVLGEFPWAVRTGDQVNAQDYIAPPLMLSSEATKDEITWSLGTYTSPKSIEQAFKLDKPLPAPRGVFANQPNPHADRSALLWQRFLPLAALLVVMLVVRLVTAGNATVFTDRFEYSRATRDTNALVTPLFTLGGHTSNVQIRIDTDLANAWAYFNLALLADTGGTGYEMGREVAYYSGVDEDGSWAEGSRNDVAIIPAVPPGQYYLRIEPEGAPELHGAGMMYTVQVRRDVPRVWPFGVALLVLMIPPLFVSVRSLSFERSRWAESDYAPETAAESLSDSLEGE